MGEQSILKNHHIDLCSTTEVKRRIEWVRGKQFSLAAYTLDSRKKSHSCFKDEGRGEPQVRLLLVYLECWGDDSYFQQIQLGSLAGAAQSLNGNEIDQSGAQKGQKPFEDVKAKSSVDFDFQ